MVDLATIRPGALGNLNRGADPTLRRGYADRGAATGGPEHPNNRCRSRAGWPAVNVTGLGETDPRPMTGQPWPTIGPARVLGSEQSPP